MADTLTQQQRQRCMAKVGSKDTGPEIVVRQALRVLGLPFKLHPKTLPGKPDIVMPRLKLALFIHGCFWHGHARCKRALRPVTNTDFWNRKLDSNIRRDKIVRKKLRDLGWRTKVIWECQTRKKGFKNTLSALFSDIP
jgi:DNA mismatch endonuclease, patch repair protein